MFDIKKRGQVRTSTCSDFNVGVGISGEGKCTVSITGQLLFK